MTLSREKSDNAGNDPDPLPDRRNGAANGTGAGKRRPIKLGSIDTRMGYHVRRLQLWVFRDFISTLSSLDIRPAQYSVLTVIAANSGLSQSDLSATLGIERSRLVRILDGLEDAGLVVRLRAPDDRRSHALRLTDEGADLLARADALADAHESRLAEQIGPDYKTLLTILKNSCGFTRRV